MGGANRRGKKRQRENKKRSPNIHSVSQHRHAAGQPLPPRLLGAHLFLPAGGRGAGGGLGQPPENHVGNHQYADHADDGGGDDAGGGAAVVTVLWVWKAGRQERAWEGRWEGARWGIAPRFGDWPTLTLPPCRPHTPHAEVRSGGVMMRGVSPLRVDEEREREARKRAESENRKTRVKTKKLYSRPLASPPLFFRPDFAAMGQVRRPPAPLNATHAHKHVPPWEGAGESPAHAQHTHSHAPPPFPPIHTQAMSFGLTQYDVEELIAYCGGKCERGRWGCEEGGGRPKIVPCPRPTPFLPPRTPPPPTQSPNPRLKASTAASAPSTKAAKATSRPTSSSPIPELSINPLARRLERAFECVNFREFVSFLAAFSSRATKEDRIKLIFHVFDADGDGRVGREDVDLTLRALVGASLTEDEITAAVDAVLEGAGGGWVDAGRFFRSAHAA